MAILEQVWQFCHRQFLCVIASVLFYTSIPLPYLPDLKFQRVALFAPAIGLLIGAILGLLDMLFDYLINILITYYKKLMNYFLYLS